MTKLLQLFQIEAMLCEPDRGEVITETQIIERHFELAYQRYVFHYLKLAD